MERRSRERLPIFLALVQPFPWHRSGSHNGSPARILARGWNRRSSARVSVWRTDDVKSSALWLDERNQSARTHADQECSSEWRSLKSARKEGWIPQRYKFRVRLMLKQREIYNQLLSQFFQKFCKFSLSNDILYSQRDVWCMIMNVIRNVRWRLVWK